MELPRRRLLAGLGASGVTSLSGCSGLGPGGGAPAAGSGPPTADRPPYVPYGRRELRDAVEDLPGVRKDSIPSIDDPEFVPADGADGAIPTLDPGDPVFGVVRNGVAKAYPQHVLSWHEVVNDAVGGDPVAVTYCPLTGTVRGFERGDVELGVSGTLLNSNLIVYDRATDSRWPQMYATAIDGPLAGEALREFRLVWARWADWRAAHPDTRVLTAETGYERRYHDDQYGGYNPRQGYYDYGGPMHEVLVENDPDATGLADKTVVLGVRTPDGAVAFGKERLLDERVLTATVGGLAVVAVADSRVGAGHAYANPDRAEVRPVEGGAGYEVNGEAHDPADLPLDRLAAFDAMWFAWLACYPDTGRVA